MKINKSPFYIWTSVLLANLIVVLVLIDTHLSSVNIIVTDSIILGLSLFLTIVPVLIASSNNKLRNYFGYGIPVGLLLGVLYSIYYFYTCIGKFCEAEAMLLGIAFGVSAIVSALFYIIGVYAKKWSENFILTIIWIEILILAALILGLLFSASVSAISIFSFP